MTNRLLLAVGILAVGAARLGAQPDLSEASIKVIRVTEGVYMLEGPGGNIGLSIGSDNPFLVDDQYAPLTAKVRAAIRTVTPKDVRFVLNTHWHSDHTGGNENFAGSGAIIVAQENVRRRMGTEQFIAAMNSKVPPSAKPALPVVTFGESVTLHVNGDSVKAIHVRDAHTDGDVIVHFQKANVIHMGDTYFNAMYPFIDWSSGGTVAGTIAAADRALALSNDQTKFIPGHGPLGTRADLVRYRDMLKAISDAVSKMVAEGKTSEQVIAAKPSAAFDAAWGNGFLKPDQFIGTLYATLQASRNK